jgi:RNA polymerase sigma factor (sigma-70 family)
MSDEQLERSWETHPEAALRAVYDRYSSPLLRFLYRFTRSSEVSEEILQDVFVELLAGKYRPSDGGSLKAWLFTVAKNRGLNYSNRAARTVNWGTHDFRAPQDLEQNAVDQQRLQNLSAAEQTLSVDLRETWALRKQGLDYQQIADKLAIPVGTVKSRFSRLVQSLKKEFQNES